MKNLVVLENFYQNPVAVRDYALNKVSYLSKDRLAAGFAGTESETGFYSQAVISKIEKALCHPIVVNPKKFAFGVFSKTYAADEPKKTIHVDGSEWTAVVYLNRPEECQGGTSFFESKTWGWSEIPAEAELKSMGFESRQKFIEGPLKETGQRLDDWKLSARIGMKFNRMALFRSGDMFHAAEGYFGDNDQNCRLLQLFFFNLKKVEA